GDVFISASGTITLSNGFPTVTATNLGSIILYSASNITVGATTYTTPTFPASNIGIFPNQNVQPFSSLSGNSVITITPSAVSSNLVPGGFLSIILPNNSLTINTG